MELNGQPLSLEQIAAVVSAHESVQVSAAARERVVASRKIIEDIVKRDAVVYGVNTGFGKLADVRIPHDELRHLQLNLVRSHACGIGSPPSLTEEGAPLLFAA